jgi:iron complex transport system substrate-binding protein
VAEILQMIRVLAGIVGVTDKGEQLARELEAGLDRIRVASEAWPRRPRVYFEEWDDPLISGIQWVEELVEIAGGAPVFPDRRHARLAKDRIVTSEEVIAAAPDVIIGSWCGKPVRKERIVARPGWHGIPAVQRGQIYEVKSSFILQPGPAALTEGVGRIHALLRAIAE